MNKTDKTKKQEKTEQSSAETKKISVQAQTINKEKVKTSEQAQKSSTPPEDIKKAKAVAERKKKLKNKIKLKITQRQHHPLCKRVVKISTKQQTHL